METNRFDDDLLARYLAGECSAEEAGAIDRRLEQDLRYREDVELMACAWDVAAGLPPAGALAGMWNKIAAALEAPTAPAAPAMPATPASPLPVFPRMTVTPSVSKRRLWLMPLAAAAVLALVAGGTLAVWRLREHRAPAALAGATGAAAQEFRTPRGQRATMTLLDGTRVALGPDSRLWVRIGESGAREAVLDGEGVFTVVHDTTRPFRVRARGTVTEDLGTTFGIRAYAGEPVRVVVRDGVVAMRDTTRDQAVVLAARDLAQVGLDGRITVEHAVNPDAYLAWTAGRLVFQHTPLVDVVAQLERWYDVHVVVDDPALLRTTVNAGFDDDLDGVLRVLSEALDVHIERRDRWIYLRDRR